MPNGNVWKWIATGLAGIVVGGGGIGLAGGGNHDHPEKLNRPQVEQAIATAPPIVILQQDVEHLVDEAEKNQVRNEEQHKAILEAIKELRP